MKFYFYLNVIAFALLSVSCSKEAAYYHFSSSDYEYLLDYDLGDEVKIENQQGKEITLVVVKSEISKETMDENTFMITSPMFYFDQKEIILMDEDNDDFFIQIIFESFPSNTNSTMLHGDIFFYAMNDVDFLKMPIDFNLEFKEMIIDDKTYSNVIEYKTYSYESKYYEHLGYSKDVNAFYYDIKQGILGFDDVEGNKWRIDGDR